MRCPGGGSLRCIVAATVCTPGIALAQVQASESGRVSQTVDGTTVTVEYYRPQARGRVLYGGLVKWRDTWTPGANWATTLEVSRPVRLSGQRLAAGQYGIWLRPERDKDWTLLLHRTARAFHLWPPPPDDEVLRLTVRPEETSHTEVLTWWFPAVMRDATVLRLQWGITSISVHVQVEPSRPASLTPDIADRYVGSWNILTDSTRSHSVDVKMSATGGGLVVSGLALAPLLHRNLEIVPIGGNQFHPRRDAAEGADWPTSAFTIIFRVERGNAIALEVRDDRDRVVARGVRSPP